MDVVIVIYTLKMAMISIVIIVCVSAVFVL